jgi:hypothetical protein
MTWDQLSHDNQSKLRSAADSYADDEPAYDAARSAYNRGEREGWFG